jgi:hypothetical protein
MSTQINNGKRHVYDRAVYSGAPNQKKRVKNKNVETKITIKYNLCALSAALLVGSQLEGPDNIKLLIMVLALVGGFQVFKEGEE